MTEGPDIDTNISDDVCFTVNHVREGLQNFNNVQFAKSSPASSCAHRDHIDKRFQFQKLV